MVLVALVTQRPSYGFCIKGHDLFVFDGKQRVVDF